MNTGNLTLMIALVVVAVMLLFMFNMNSFFVGSASNNIVSPVEVKLVGVFKGNDEKVLNYKEQSTLIKAINKAAPIKQNEVLKSASVNFDKIVIERFSKPAITITPITWMGNSLVFSSSDLNSNSYLKDNSGGELQEVLSQKPEEIIKEAPKAQEPPKEQVNIRQTGATSAPYSKPNKAKSGPFVGIEEVKGITLVFKDQKSYPLSIAQEQSVVSYINKATPVTVQATQEKGETTKLDKIIIYKFNPPDIEINAVAYLDNELVFNEDLWYPGGLLKENSRGEMKTFITQISQL